MKPENQVHGQFTYFQALIEDECLVFNFPIIVPRSVRKYCTLHLSVTEDTLVQFYKEIDDGVDGYSPTRYEIVNFDTVEDNELMLNFDKHYIFLQFSSEIEIKEFFAYFKKEIESSLDLDRQSILQTESQYYQKQKELTSDVSDGARNLLNKMRESDWEKEQLEREERIIRAKKYFKIFKSVMQDKSHTEIKKDFLKIVDKIPLGDKANPNKVKIRGRFDKWISELTEIPEKEISELFTEYTWNSHKFEKEDVNFINSFYEFKNVLCSIQYRDEVVQEAKEKIITIILKELEKHNKITRSKIRTVLFERGYPAATLADIIFEKSKK